MNVLIALDFSPATPTILDAARYWGEGPVGAHFYLLHVAEPNPDFVGWEGGPDVVRDQMAEQFRREHEELAGLAEGMREGGAEVTPLLVQGPTVDTILDQARRLDAALVVVGSHGRGATYNLLIGSVSAGVVRNSTVPVLVIPAH